MTEVNAAPADHCEFCGNKLPEGGWTEIYPCSKKECQQKLAAKAKSAAPVGTAPHWRKAIPDSEQQEFIRITNDAAKQIEDYRCPKCWDKDIDGSGLQRAWLKACGYGCVCECHEYSGRVKTKAETIRTVLVAYTAAQQSEITRLRAALQEIREHSDRHIPGDSPYIRLRRIKCAVEAALKEQA